MNPQERLSDAVEREVKEETGVSGQFAGIVGLREQTNFKYGASDFYFVSVLTCDSQNIAIEDVNEVQCAEWVDLDKITDFNSETEPPEVFLYQTAFEFITRIKAMLRQKP